MLKPRAYQAVGSAFLKTHRRAMLFDAPGLGKTLQASLAANPPVLVAAPTYLTVQWYDFLVDQFPNATVSIAQGARYQRELSLSEKADWYIINTEMLRSYDIPKVTTVIFDESHHLRGRNSQQAKGALKVAESAKYAYMLTATPIVKDPDDLFMQLRILYPKMFTSYYSFIDRYCLVKQTPYGPKVEGEKNKAIINKMLRNFALGRSYKEAGLELPELIERELRVQMPAKLWNKYQEVRVGYIFEDIPLDYMVQVLNILRQMTFCNEKLEALLSTIADNEAYDAVIFCWFRETAYAIGKLLDIPAITGKMDATERKKTAKQNDMVVATISSLSEGVDLSKSRNVIFFECDYTYGSMYQALSRVRRYSDDNTPVNVWYINMKGTIDEIVYQKSKQRGATVKEILKEVLG